jgi:transcriptional regulator with XRE-family HTH domain
VTDRCAEWRGAIAANIRAERARAGIDQELLAEWMRFIGFGSWRQQTVSYIETGRRSVSACEILGLAHVIGIPVARLGDVT